jgi:hypothetical protein
MSARFMLFRSHSLLTTLLSGSAGNAGAAAQAQMSSTAAMNIFSYTVS